MLGPVQVGILGGTGPGGRGLAVRLAAGGLRVVIGSRDPARAEEIAGELNETWVDRVSPVAGAGNGEAAGAEQVIVATPWESAAATAGGLAGALRGKVVVSVGNALVREGRETFALLPPRGSVAAGLQAALPDSLVSAAFHHLPARQLADLDVAMDADVLVCSDYPEATRATMALVERMKGLRPLDAGSLAQAAAIEAFTAVCVTLNLRYRAHSSVKLSGI
jgi:8-hydroxy-5-deazaflavin:NADPH oxidoreductase